MNKTRIGINGFGRIGRQFFRAVESRYPDMLEVVAVNGLSQPEINAHLLKYDSTYGVYSGEVKAEKDSIFVDGRHIRLLGGRDPASLPWREEGVSIVIEATGKLRDSVQSQAHLEAGANKVIISAPGKNEDALIILGVNDEIYDPVNHHIVSAGSCTTNCAAIIAKVLDDSFGIQSAFVSTVHSYTSDQSLLDRRHKDFRRARSAATSIIPTTTGAAKAVGKVIPHLAGRLDGIAYRVPTVTGSLVDFVTLPKKSCSESDINEAFKLASERDLKDFLSYTEEPLVSVDYIGNPYSCTLDALSTTKVSGGLIKTVGWYDNEWGYACRLSDLAAMVARQGS